MFDPEDITLDLDPAVVAWTEAVAEHGFPL